jgi:hypothetical protein
MAGFRLRGRKMKRVAGLGYERAVEEEAGIKSRDSVTEMS